MTDKLFIALLNAYSAHSKKSRNACQTLGLSSGQPKVLYVLKQNEGKLQKEIAELCAVEQSTMTVLVKSMETKNWIRREPVVVSGGKRAYSLYLTAEGNDLAQKIESVVENLEKAGFQGFSEAEKASLLVLLGRVEENLLRLPSPFYEVSDT